MPGRSMWTRWTPSSPTGSMDAIERCRTGLALADCEHRVVAGHPTRRRRSRLPTALSPGRNQTPFRASSVGCFTCLRVETVATRSMGGERSGATEMRRALGHSLSDFPSEPIFLTVGGMICIKEARLPCNGMIALSVLVYGYYPGGATDPTSQFPKKGDFMRHHLSRLLVCAALAGSASLAVVGIPAGTAGAATQLTVTCTSLTGSNTSETASGCSGADVSQTGTHGTITPHVNTTTHKGPPKLAARLVAAADLRVTDGR